MTFVLLLSLLTYPISLEKGVLPSPYGMVNDFAGIIDSSSTAKITKAILDFQKKTSIEIAVVTIPSFAPYSSVDEYANELFRSWKIGKTKENNGLLILTALKEKKIRIEVGYGLEEIVPDGLAGEIIRTKILPSFKEGDYSDGLVLGVNALIAVIAQKKGIEPSASESNSKKTPFDSPFLLNLIIFVLVAFFLLTRIFLPPFRVSRRNRNQFWGIGGGGFGGGFGGFGGSGGGFGGFGGGGSGGGGASGSWILL